MDEEHQKEVDATQTALSQLVSEGCKLTGDDLLNLATERAGYNVQKTRVEQCSTCGALYHRDYGGEYIDPFDYTDLMHELRIRGMAKLYYMHFCDFECLQQKAYANYTPY